jgi:hypothetical protein
MTPFLTKQELEKKRKAKESLLPKIKKEAGETEKAFLDRLLKNAPIVKTIEVPRQRKFTGVPEVSLGGVVEKKIKKQEEKKIFPNKKVVEEEPVERTITEKVMQPGEDIIPGFKHFITDIIDSNEVYRMQDDIFGLEYGESISEKENLDTYEELLSNEDIKGKLRNRALANYKALHPNQKIDDYFVDVMVNDVIANKIQEEQETEAKWKKEYADKSILAGKYDNVLNLGIDTHIKQVSPEEQFIIKGLAEARKLQKIVDNPNVNQDEYAKAFSKLGTLDKNVKNALKEYDSKYSFHFDNVTGRRLTKEEVDNRIKAGEGNTMTDQEKQIAKMRTAHKNSDLESLERGYFSHLYKYNNYISKLNKTYDLNPSDIVLRNSLATKGYKFKPGTNIFTGVKLKDLIPFVGSSKGYDKSIEKAFVDAAPPGKGTQVRQLMVPYLKDLIKEKTPLMLEREAYKLSYLMNIDPKSMSQGYGERFLESVSDATIGVKATRDLFKTSSRTKLDQIKEVFNDAGVKPTKEQEDNFRRDDVMKITEGVGTFLPELPKFAIANAISGGILGSTAFGARMAALGRSTKLMDKIVYNGFNALKEEAIFKTVTAGESQTGGGAGFYLGGKLVGKLGKFSPINLTGRSAAFRPFVQKVIQPGVGMSVGSEGAAIVESIYKDVKDNKSFKMSMEDLYGNSDETTSRMMVNLAIGGLIGAKDLKLATDFKSIAAKRDMVDNLNVEIENLEAENNPKNKKTIEQKINLMNSLNLELNFADQAFNDLDVLSLKQEIKKAKAEIESGKLDERQKLEAENFIAEGGAKIDAVRRNLIRDFNAKAKAGAFGKDTKLVVVDGEEAMGNGNKAEFKPNGEIWVNIEKFRKGVLGHEVGHAMVKAAFEKNKDLAQKMKDAIQPVVEKALQSRRQLGGSLEKTIDKFYSEAELTGSKRPEEYIMNVVELLQEPSLRDAMLNTDILPTFRRALGEIGNKIGFDFTSNKALDVGEKNADRASDLLEFLYELGTSAEGRSASALKNKFKKFDNILIDGKKLINEKTGEEIITEEKAIGEIESMASKEISENEKKDIFSKATRAYEDAMKSGSSPEIAGLMVGMEMEPLIKKQVERYLISKGITMSRDQIQDIVDSLTTDSGTGTFGVPSLTQGWTKGQEIIKYINTENPTREQINNKAKELGIQDRTSAGSESSTIDKYIKMAKGETEQAQLTSYIFGNLPKRILQTLQKSEFSDSFNTFSMEDVKNIDKLEESAGISGASGSNEQGYIDISSPEKYTRDSQKNAETILELPAPLVEKINTDANKFLNSQKLENLDAKSIGTVPLKDGGKAKVAMLESDKARITYPDGRVETIKARSPKLVEQYLGAADKSFEKDFNFKEGLSEDFKNSLFNDLSKHAGNIIDNKRATPEYAKFIDNAFPLFKTFLSQYSVNKRFADFKEPYIDPATGKQAREKTAAGNPIFTKKNITLAEWRKYFLGDGTQRIDGKRRSIIEALAVELGFDATMNVLGKEAMREQLELRQGELSVKLVENYVAVIGKQIDRGIETMASKDLRERVQEKFGLSKEVADFRIVRSLFDENNNIRSNEEIWASPIGRFVWELQEYNAENRLANDIEARIAADKENANFKQKLKADGIKFDYENIKDFVTINKKSEKELKEYEEEFVKPFAALVPREVSEFTTAANTKLGNNELSLYGGNSILAPFLSYTSRQDIKGELLNRTRFEEVTKDAKTNIELSPELKNEWEELIKQARANNKKGKGITIITKSKDHQKKIDVISKSNLDPKEKINLIDNLPSREEAIIDTAIKNKLFELKLKTIKEMAQSLDQSKAGDPARERLAKHVAAMVLNNDKFGPRKYSSEIYYDLSMPADAKTKNEHLTSKARFGADLVGAIKENKLTDEKITELLTYFESALGNKEGQIFADIHLGKTADNAKFYKLAIAQMANITVEKSKYKEALENVYNWTTKKTAWQELIESDLAKEFSIKDETSEPMASKDLSKDLSEMIERKKGLPAGEEISAAKAAILGRKKGNFEFFVPANAEDFAGMLYKFYGKGEQGNKDMELMKKALLDPYERGENALSSYRQKLTTDLKAMDAQLNELGGKVTNESKEALKKSGFDADQATRVYIWNKKGEKIPDITDTEVKELSDIVANDARLRSYADGVMSLVDFPAPTDSWYGSNLKYDLYKYSTEGVRKDFLAEWKENMDAMFTKENYIRMEAAYGKGFVENFKSLTKRMETGKFRPENINRAAQKGLDWINGSVGVIMWMNMRSALLQTTSAINYINWGDNNILAAGKTIAKPVEFAKTFKELINSDFLKQRRNGLEINIEDAEIARAIEKGGNAPQRIFGQLIKAGFKPTQMADSFSIAIGGTPFYMNRTKTYQKEVIIDSNGNEVRKYTDAEAKKKAFDDFRALSEEHQQSSRQDRVSNVQLGVLGRLIFAFNNTQMQMARLQKKATLDIINKRGDMKTNVSKLVYYGVVQSAIFTALQQGAFGMMFGKDEDELKEGEAEHIAKKKEEKVVGMLNSMVDGTLTGIGLAGKLAVTAKNTLLKYQDESAKGYKANYGKVVNEALSISPPLSSKTKKAASAFEDIKRLSTKKGQKEVEESGAFNNPYNMPRAKLVAAATNIPVDRVLTKLDNLITAIDDENIQGWQRAALSLGWDKYSLGMYEDEYLDPTEQAAADAKEKAEKSAEAKATRDAKKALEQAEYDALPQVTKDSLDLVKIKAKEKKSRDKYIEEQVRKSKLTPEQLEYEKYLAKEKRKKSKEKARITKIRNQKIKDSINYANTRR